MGTPKAGRVSDLYMDGVKIGGVQDVTFDLQQAEIDVTDKDSAGWDEFINGQRSLMLSGTMVYEEDDVGQDNLLDAIINGTQHEFRFRPWGESAGADEWIGYGFPTSDQIDSPNKEAISSPFSVRLSRQPTRQNQDVFAGTFQLLLEDSGAEQLPLSMTINSTTYEAKWAYRGGDAGYSIWPAAAGPRDLSRITPSGGVSLSVDQPAPFTDHTRGVKCNGGEYFSGGDYDAYEWGGAGGGEDWVLEVALRIDDLTDTGQIMGKSDGAGGWKLSISGGALRLQVFDTGGVANVTIDSAALEEGTNYHIIYFLDQSGSGVAYTCASAGTAQSLATVSGSADVTALEFAIGNEDSGAAAAGGQATVYWAAAWGATGWLDTHLQASVAAERLAYLAGVYPKNASGTTVAPTTMSRSDAAWLFVREPVGQRVLGHKVGPNWPRVCSWGATWGSPTGTPVAGLNLEIASENTIRESHDPTSVTSWGFTRISTAVASVASPLHAQEVYAVTSDATDANTHFISQGLTPIATGAAISIFAKRKTAADNGSNWVFLGGDGAAGSTNGAFFDIQTGTVGTIGANVTRALIEDWGNGWFRLMIQMASSSSSGFTFALAEADNDLSIAVAPDGDANCYICAPMRESAGGVELASSYIRNENTASDQTRAADSLIYKMDDGNMSSPETAFTVDYAVLAANVDLANSPRLFTLNDGGSAADQIRVRGWGSGDLTNVDIASTEGAGESATCGATDVYDGGRRDFRARLNGTALVHENTTDSESNSNTLAFAGPNDIDQLNIMEDGYSSALLQKIEIYASDLGASF